MHVAGAAHRRAARRGTVARLGGDEFIVVVQDLDARAVFVAASIHAGLQEQPGRFVEHLNVAASIRIASPNQWTKVVPLACSRPPTRPLPPPGPAAAHQGLQLRRCRSVSVDLHHELARRHHEDQLASSPLAHRRPGRLPAWSGTSAGTGWTPAPWAAAARLVPRPGAGGGHVRGLGRWWPGGWSSSWPPSMTEHQWRYRSTCHDQLGEQEFTTTLLSRSPHRSPPGGSSSTSPVVAESRPDLASARSPAVRRWRAILFDDSVPAWCPAVLPAGPPGRRRQAGACPSRRASPEPAAGKVARRSARWHAGSP